MMDVQIDGAWYKADEAVVKRMGEYYEAMKTAHSKLDKLVTATLNMRDAQKAYFSTRDAYNLRKSKALETQLDDMLAGKGRAKEQQAKLFG